MSTRSEAKKLLREAERAGAVVRQGGSHKKLYVDGRLVTVIGASKQTNDLKASARALRRAGLAV